MRKSPSCVTLLLLLGVQALAKKKVYDLPEMLIFDAINRNIPFEMDRTFKSRMAVPDACRKFGNPVAKRLPDLRQH